jgi:hypothetical protein
VTVARRTCRVSCSSRRQLSSTSAMPAPLSIRGTSFRSVSLLHGEQKNGAWPPFFLLRGGSGKYSWLFLCSVKLCFGLGNWCPGYYMGKLIIKVLFYIGSFGWLNALLFCFCFLTHCIAKYILVNRLKKSKQIVLPPLLMGPTKVTRRFIWCA